jgi:uncharacterized repeat protein (TIGR03803 family)
MLTRGCIIGAAAIACAVAMPQSTGATVKILHAFCARPSCADGQTPQYPPIADSNGVLYGTTPFGGAYGGVVYALTPDGSGGYAFRVLHTFLGTDGDSPSSPLIVDTNGNLYGFTFSGGAYGQGALFELRHNADRTQWTDVVRYSFCAGGAPCADGKWPIAQIAYPGANSGAPYDGVSPIYGISQYAGSGNNANGAGMAFRITPVAGHTKWKETVLYNFCSQPNCTDGAAPESGLTINANGVLFGTTVNGGSTNGWGTVFKIYPKQQTESVIYSFCPGFGCTDGINPEGPLGLDSKGHLYGTTAHGGAGGRSIIFKITPSASTPETVLYNFCGAPNCTDGAYPEAGVTIDPNGNLFGVTRYGGADYSSNCDSSGIGCGALYRFSPRKSKLAVLHSFCKAGLPDCGDGAEPLYGRVSLDGSGNAFGVTSEGGLHSGGTVFEYLP